ncbi:MAG: lytic murein transglycosylase B [Succinivibrionaceae bacterium]|nr:lytic murein transglycosylase B [Succinivibrionaceae bacterium]
MKSFTSRMLALTLAAVLPASALSAELTETDRAYLRELSAEHGVPLKSLEKAYREARIRPSIIKAMNRPGEAKPWYEYRKIFITDKRIRDGIAFMKEWRYSLEDAYRETGVNPEIITAIIGVETGYGANMGKYEVLDALYTLGFNYPKRGKYFRSEFANFVKLADREGWGYRDKLGSYAGAMGMCQFMPSNYLRLTTDFDHDGKVDLFRSPVDAIGSVAKYFQKSGWVKDGQSAWEAGMPGGSVPGSLLLDKSLKVDLPYSRLKAAGVTAIGDKNLHPDSYVKLLRLEDEKAPHYYVVSKNFYVITRYNHSPLYAMAVYQLSEKIRAGLDEENRRATR